MKKQNIKALVLAIALLSLSLTGCGAKYTTQEAAYVPEEDFQYLYGTTAGNPTIAESEDGYIFLAGNYLFFTDKTNLETIPLCQKTGCLHYTETDEKNTINCNAYVKPVGAIGLQYYQNKLYFIESDSQNRPSVTEMDLTSGSRKTLYSFEKAIFLFSLHRGYLYFSGTSYTMDGTADYALQRVALFSGGKQVETLYEGKLSEGCIQEILPYQDRIYFREDGMEDGIHKINLVYYDCKEETCKKIDRNVQEDGETYGVSFVGFYQDKLLMRWGRTDEADNIVSKYKWYDIATSEITEFTALPTEKSTMDYTDGTYIYKHDTFEDQLFLRMYDRNGRELAAIPMESNGGYPGRYIIPGNDLLFETSYHHEFYQVYKKSDLVQGIVKPYVLLDEDINELNKGYFIGTD